MKKSDIEKRLQSDLKNATPSDFESLKRACGLQGEKRLAKATVPVYKRAVATAGGGATSKGGFSFGKIMAGTLAFALAVVVAVTALFGLFGRKNKPVGGYFILDINPSVEIDYDADGKVTEVIGLNEDGRVLLYGLQSQKGKTYDDVANVIVNRCLKLGYFTVEDVNNAILVSATSLKGGKDETRTNEMKVALTNVFSEKKMAGVVITGVVNEALNETATSYGIDVQKYGLILHYLKLCNLDENSENGQAVLREYAKKSVRALYEAIDDKQDEIEENEAFAPLAEKIEHIIDSLESTQSEAMLDILKRVVEDMKKAETIGDCFVKKGILLNALNGLKEESPSLKDAIERVEADIETAFENWFENETFQKWGKTVEDLFNEREDKYRDNPDTGGENFDYENWLEENRKHEEDFSSDWFGKKNEWKELKRP